MLLGVGDRAALLVGANLPFFGTVTANIMAMVKDLGRCGLVGLITLGIILWLFSSAEDGLSRRRGFATNDTV